MSGGSATLAGAAALALAVVFGGCLSTSMSAAELRVPVLLGPVPCIGCGPAARLPAPVPSARIAGRRRFYDFLFPSYLWGLADDSQLGISADRLLYWTPCGDDLQLSNLRAHAWQLTVPFLIYVADASVEGDAQEMTVPGASCGSP
ncbi:MAG TPA: hypothetical protein VH853_23375 [Polyangia bacterium]|jgi:hypothetical protein|nr:hypothetical protein [Polyangia bacterium]